MSTRYFIRPRKQADPKLWQGPFTLEQIKKLAGERQFSKQLHEYSTDRVRWQLGRELWSELFPSAAVSAIVDAASENASLLAPARVPAGDDTDWELRDDDDDDGDEVVQELPPARKTSVKVVPEAAKYPVEAMIGVSAAGLLLTVVAAWAMIEGIRPARQSSADQPPIAGSPSMSADASPTSTAVAHSPKDIAALIVALHQNESKDACDAAVHQLAAAGPAVVAPIRSLLGDPNPEVVRAALRVLQELGPKAAYAVPEVTHLLELPRTEVLIDAFKTLQQIGLPANTAVPVLEAIARRSLAAHVGAAAAQAAEALVPDESQRSTDLQLLLVEHGSPETAQAALNLLSKTKLFSPDVVTMSAACDRLKQRLTESETRAADSPEHEGIRSDGPPSGQMAPNDLKTRSQRLEQVLTQSGLMLTNGETSRRLNNAGPRVSSPKVRTALREMLPKLTEYDAKRDAWDGSSAGLVTLAKWCRGNGLLLEAEQCLRAVLLQDPLHSQADTLYNELRTVVGPNGLGSRIALESRVVAGMSTGMSQGALQRDFPTSPMPGGQKRLTNVAVHPLAFAAQVDAPASYAPTGRFESPLIDAGATRKPDTGNIYWTVALFLDLGGDKDLLLSDETLQFHAEVAPAKFVGFQYAIPPNASVQGMSRGERRTQTLQVWEEVRFHKEKKQWFARFRNKMHPRAAPDGAVIAAVNLEKDDASFNFPLPDETAEWPVTVVVEVPNFRALTEVRFQNEPALVTDSCLGNRLPQDVISDRSASAAVRRYAARQLSTTTAPNWESLAATMILEKNPELLPAARDLWRAQNAQYRSVDGSFYRPMTRAPRFVSLTCQQCYPALVIGPQTGKQATLPSLNGPWTPETNPLVTAWNLNETGQYRVSVAAVDAKTGALVLLAIGTADVRNPGVEEIAVAIVAGQPPMFGAVWIADLYHIDRADRLVERAVHGDDPNTAQRAAATVPFEQTTVPESTVPSRVQVIGQTPAGGQSPFPNPGSSGFPGQLDLPKQSDFPGQRGFPGQQSGLARPGGPRASVRSK